LVDKGFVLQYCSFGVCIIIWAGSELEKSSNQRTVLANLFNLEVDNEMVNNDLYADFRDLK
jgi:hypothetical protein